MHGETCDSEAARDVMFAQHRIGGQPLAQALGQHLRLFRSSFGHQHDEFIAAIARHDVRLPRLLLEQAADARQDEVAFEVSHGVVHFFELVEIDEHH